MKIRNAISFARHKQEDKYIYLTNEVAYFFQNILSKVQVGLVMRACFCYMEKKPLPELDQTSRVVFCKMLMDNGLIAVNNFKVNE